MSSRIPQLLIVFCCLSLPAPVFTQGDTTIGPVDPNAPSGTPLWMYSDEIEFHQEGLVFPGRISTAMMVKWAGHDIKIKDLTQEQKTYLWNKTSPQQRQQLNNEYGKIGFGMGGYLQQRPDEWGKIINECMAEYQLGVNGWGQVRQQNLNKHTPPEVKQFQDDKAEFLKENQKTLQPGDIGKIEKGAEGIIQLGQIIATLQAKKVAVAVKGLSGGLLGIITDYFSGFATSGAQYASDAIATLVSKIIDMGKNSANKSLSPADQLALLNKQIEAAKQALNNEIEKQKKLWASMLTVEISMCFLVDCSGSMDGQKIEQAKAALIDAVNQTNDGRHEWALLGFGGDCMCWEVASFTTDAATMRSAAQELRANGSTPLRLAAYKATTYLVKNGNGKEGQLIILCDGEDTCHANAGQEDPARTLVTITSYHDTTRGGQQP